MKNFIVILAIIAGLASCKKSTPTPTNNCTPSVTSLAATYKITAITYKSSASATEVDVFSSIPDCQKDDLFALNSDGTVNLTEGATSCGLPPSPGSPNAWFLTNNNNTILLGDNTYNIKTFDCNTLVVTEADINVSGDSRTTTFVKQK